MRKGFRRRPDGEAVAQGVRWLQDANEFDILMAFRFG